MTDVERLAEESSLSAVKLSIDVRASLEALHSSMLIFRLFKEIDAVISKIAMQRYELYFWHCPALSSYVHLCPFMSSYCAEKACIYQKKSVTLQHETTTLLIPS